MGSKPIVVGIDGSQAAIAAAIWGVDEAIARGVPLRLVSVVQQAHLLADDNGAHTASAQAALGKAQRAIEGSGRFVDIQTDILQGPAASVLVALSLDAEMVCVGSVGIGWMARALFGSTATDVAQKAKCSVAVLRSDIDQPPPDIEWVIVRMTDAPGNDTVVEYAAWEAKLRRAPMLVLGGRPEELTEHADGAFERRVQDWRRRHAEVRVYPITTKFAIASFMATHDQRVQLAVINGVEADQLAGLVGPVGHPLFSHPNCSVLVVRD